MNKLPVTVIILTLNEEENLSAALDSVLGKFADVFVVDSLSSDRTVDIALQRGVKIVQRPFTNYGDQWNWAMTTLPIKTEWILKLDADECVSEELFVELQTLFACDPRHDGFLIPIRLWFLGRPLHVVMRKNCRLWRSGKARMSAVVVNEHLVVDGPMGRLKHYIEHRDSPNLHRWVEKQNRYTTMEAIMRFNGDQFGARPNIWGRSIERRMFYKKNFYAIPFRYQWQWLYECFGRGAIWDGIVGRMWIHLRITVNRLIEIKFKEISLTGKIPKVFLTPEERTFDPRVLETPLQRSIFPVISDALVQPRRCHRNETLQSDQTG